MQGSVLRSKEMCGLMSLQGGGSSGDEMMEVLVVGLGSVGEKVDQSHSRSFVCKVNTIV